MKKTLSVLALLGIFACSVPMAQAFTWSDLNPFNWGRCNKCEKYQEPTGYASPCNPCEKKVKKQNCPCKVKQQAKPCEPCQKVRENCDPCDQLQNMNK